MQYQIQILFILCNHFKAMQESTLQFTLICYQRLCTKLTVSKTFINSNNVLIEGRNNGLYPQLLTDIFIQCSVAVEMHVPVCLPAFLWLSQAENNT